MTDSPYCDKVKRGEDTAEDFAAFLHHLGLCEDCQRRLVSQIVIKFKQQTNGDK